MTCKQGFMAFPKLNSNSTPTFAGLTINGALTVQGGISTFSRADSTPAGVANTVANDGVFGSTDTVNTGITIFGTGQGSIAFGDAGGDAQGLIAYVHATDMFNFKTDMVTRLSLDASELLLTSVDLVLNNPVNDGNPFMQLGATALETLLITSTFDTGAQTLDFVTFETKAASATANKGEMRFSVDETLRLTINDDGLAVVSGATAANSFSVIGDSLTDGAVGLFSSNSASTAVRPIVSMINDNVLAVSATVLRLQQDSSGVVLDITGPLTASNNIVNIASANALTIGSAISIISNSPSTGARLLLRAVNDHVDAVNAKLIGMQQDAAGAFLEFIGASTGAGTTQAISTLTTSGAVLGHVQIDVLGSKRWFAFLADPS